MPNTRTPTISPEMVLTLFDAIKHGDDEHQTWLKEAIENHFAGKPVPPPRMGQKKPDPTSYAQGYRAAVEAAKVAREAGVGWPCARSRTAILIALEIERLPLPDGEMKK